MFKPTKEVERVCRKLLSAPRLDVGNLRKDEVPRHKGVYLWRKKSSGKIVYVGTALGKGGLVQRILKQHLNPKYRQQGKEKSTLRIRVIEDDTTGVNLTPGEECIFWITKNLSLSFWPRERVETQDVIFSLAEKILIAEKRPLYNEEWKSVQEQRAREKSVCRGT